MLEWWGADSLQEAGMRLEFAEKGWSQAWKSNHSWEVHNGMENYSTAKGTDWKSLHSNGNGMSRHGRPLQNPGIKSTPGHLEWQGVSLQTYWGGIALQSRHRWDGLLARFTTLLQTIPDNSHMAFHCRPLQAKRRFTPDPLERHGVSSRTPWNKEGACLRNTRKSDNEFCSKAWDDDAGAPPSGTEEWNCSRFLESLVASLATS